MDIVQRHAAGPRELHGTEEFLCLSLLCLLHRSGDKGCSGSLGVRQCLQTRAVPCPLDVPPIGRRESCHNGAVTAFRRRRPYTATRRHAQSTCTHQATLPAQAQVSRTQTWGGACLLEEKTVDHRLILDLAPECALAMTASFPSALHIHYSSRRQVTGGTAPLPLDLLCLLFLQQRQTPGAPAGSPPQHSASMAAELAARIGSSLSGSFPPALLWPDQGRWTKQGKSQKGLSFN